MALPPEQRPAYYAAVRKRAEELMAAGMAMGPAAQQAYSEIAPAPEKTAREALTLESEEAAKTLDKTRAKYVDQRAEVLSKEGVSRPAARSQAESEFEENYLKPVTGGYGEISERQGTGAFGLLTPAAPKSLAPRLTGAEATLSEALKPQTALPKSALPTEVSRLERPAQAEIIGAGPDYDALRKRFIESGLTPTEANAQVDAFKSAYDVQLTKYPKDTKDVASKAWKDTVDEIEAIPGALANPSNRITDYKPTGPQDPLFLAFSKQVKAGEGVPRLSPSQGRYIESLARTGRAAEEERIRREYADKPLVVAEVETVEGLRGGGSRTVNRELVGEEKEAKIRQMAAEKVEVPWWSNPEEVKRRLKLGAEETKGVFSSETAFGTQRESNIGYLARTGLAPLNAIAGAVFPILFTGTDTETRAAVEEARRQARPEAYKDSPILLNIAEGRGFVGEAAEVARLTGIDTEKLIGDITYGDIYTAGAFAADLLDPSLDIAAVGIRGTRTAIEAGSAAKKLGATAAEAAKAAGAAVVSGDVRLAISNVLAKRASEELIDPLGRVSPPPGSPEILKTVDANLNKLDNLVDDVGQGQKLSKEEFIEALGDAARLDPNVADTIRAAEEGVRAGISSKQIEVVRNNDEVRDAVQRALIRNTVRREVFKATGDSVLRNGLVALTPSTFATASEAKKILADVSKTDFMKNGLPIITKKPVVGTKKVAGALPGQSRPLSVVDGYSLDAEAYSTVNKQLQSMASRGRITQQSFNKIYNTLRNNPTFISSSDLRTIIDAGVDDVASAYRIVRGKDIAETSPLVARELTEPLATKDFTSPQLRKWISEATRGKATGVTDALTPVQRQIFDDVNGKLGKLDAKLRSDMNRILTNGDFKALYGIAPDAKLSREEAIGHLIVGPRGRGDITRTERILKLAIDKLIYGKETKQDIFDIFSGIKVDEISDVWSVKGRTELDKLVKTAARAISSDPSKFRNVLKQLNEQAIALARSADNLKIPVEDVKQAPGGLFEKPLNLQSIASYYAAEANRLINESYSNIIASEGGFINGAYTNNLSSVAKEALATIGTPLQTFSEAIGKYINGLAENPRFREGSIGDIAKAIGIEQPRLDASYQQNLYKLLSVRSQIIAEIDAIASRIMKNNGLKPSIDVIGDIVKIVDKAAQKGGPIDANMRAVLGANVAEQLQGALNAGGAKNIERGLAAALRGDERNTALRLWDGLTEMWYTLVLTAAPRFHGANIVGAPEVIFTTTGKLISPLPIPGTSTWDAMRIMQKAGGPKGGAIAVRDPAGRTYTNNEIYEAVSQRGGETAFKTDIPSIAARRALIQLQKGPTGAARRALDAVIESPQTEDTLYRMAVAVEELKAGRPMDSAIRLSRSALMDKGTITEAEDALRRTIMFYSFTRNNFVNLMKNLMTPEGWSRIARVVKTKRGVENVLMPMSEEEKAYLPETAALRIVVGKGERVGEKGTIIALPNSSTFSAIELLSKALAVDTEYFTDMLLGRGVSLLKDTGEIEVERIPPEHIFIIESIADITGAQPEDVMSILAGEPVVPFRSDEPGNVRGLVYPLTSPNARKNYKLGLVALKFIGVDRLISDIPNSLRAPGGKVAEAFKNNNLGVGTAGYAAGVISPLKTQMAERQRLRALASQNAEGRKLVKDIEEVLIGDIIQPIAADPQRMEEVRQEKSEIAQEKRSISNIEGEIMRLTTEIKSLVSRIRQAESDAEAEALEKRIEQIELRIEELEKLEEQSNR